MGSMLAASRIRLSLLAVVAIWLVGCVPLGTAQPIVTPAPTEKETAMPSPKETATPAPGSGESTALNAVLESAVLRDLAQRLKLSPDQVTLVSAEKMEMPIGSLGCEETGGTQNQGLLIGTEITLRAGDQEYVYRTDGAKLMPCTPKVFPGGRRPTYVTGASQTPAPRPQDLAVAALAKQLSISPAAITVRSVESVDWPDASLGCPQPGMMYAQVITPGYRVILEAKGKRYEYHAGTSNVILCNKGKQN